MRARHLPVLFAPLLLLAPACGMLEDVLEEGKRAAQEQVENEIAAELDQAAEWDPASGEAPPPASGPGGAWVDFESKEGRFTAQFPMSPQTETMPTPTAIGNIDQKMFTVTKGDAYYAVAIADYPEELVKQGDTAGMLDGARDGAVANVSGKLAKEEQIEVEGYPGRKIQVIATVQGVSLELDAVLCLAGNRLYQSIVARPSGSVPDAEVERFINSMKPFKS